MKRIYWLPIGLATLAVGASVAACSSEFDSCRASRTCPSAGAGNAAGGDAGSDVGGETGGGVGGNVGGEAGRAAGGAGYTGEVEAGGIGGEGGAPDLLPALFGGCSVKGMFACVEHAGAQRLACDGTLWQAGYTCAANELCDSSDGTCANVVSECASEKPGSVFCRGDTILTCGPDLVTASEGETCAGLCKLGACKAPVCGDEKLEQGEVCDDAVANASGACVKCKMGTCGDGAVYVGHEQCDDGNTVSGDGCSATCRAEPVALSLGDATTCALSSTGLVKCWGDNSSGQLGLGDTKTRGDVADTVPSNLNAIDLGVGQKAISISIRGSSACALLDSGGVKCWGNNSFGQLGTGDTDRRGDEPGEMGDALKAVPLGTGLKAIGVSAADSHTCVVVSGGGLKCWGSKESGQLGQESKVDVSSPEGLAPVKLLRPTSAVSASNYLGDGKGGQFGGATCALLDNGTVQCWGGTQWVPHSGSADLDTSYGIGDFAAEMSALPVLPFGGGAVKSVVTGSVSAAIFEDGSLRLWGTGPQLAQPDLGSNQIGLTLAELASLPPVQMGGKKVKSIAIGKYHACAILDDGALKCWGDNNSGTLGLGSTSSTDAAPKDIAAVGLGGHAALQVATGAYHTCAILSDGSVKCWGNNASGQLGLGDTKNRGDSGGTLSADTTVNLTF